MLLVELPDRSLVLLLALRHRLKAADVLHHIVGATERLDNTVVRVNYFWLALVFSRAKP